MTQRNSEDILVPTLLQQTCCLCKERGFYQKWPLCKGGHMFVICPKCTITDQKEATCPNADCVYQLRYAQVAKLASSRDSLYTIYQKITNSSDIILELSFISKIGFLSHAQKYALKQIQTSLSAYDKFINLFVQEIVLTPFQEVKKEFEKIIKRQELIYKSIKKEDFEFYKQQQERLKSTKKISQQHILSQEKEEQQSKITFQKTMIAFQCLVCRKNKLNYHKWRYCKMIHPNDQICYQCLDKLANCPVCRQKLRPNLIQCQKRLNMWIQHYETILSCEKSCRQFTSSDISKQLKKIMLQRIRSIYENKNVLLKQSYVNSFQHLIVQWCKQKQGSQNLLQIIQIVNNQYAYFQNVIKISIKLMIEKAEDYLKQKIQHKTSKKNIIQNPQQSHLKNRISDRFRNNGSFLSAPRQVSRERSRLQNRHYATSNILPCNSNTRTPNELIL